MPKVREHPERQYHKPWRSHGSSKSIKRTPLRAIRNKNLQIDEHEVQSFENLIDCRHFVDPEFIVGARDEALDSIFPDLAAVGELLYIAADNDGHEISPNNLIYTGFLIKRLAETARQIELIPASAQFVAGAKVKAVVISKGAQYEFERHRCETSANP